MCRYFQYRFVLSYKLKWLSLLLFTEANSAETRGFLDQLTDTILNNILVSIQRIHIRYEDKVTNPDHPFACGIMLKALSAETTNSAWQPTHIEGDASEVHKVSANIGGVLPLKEWINYSVHYVILFCSICFLRGPPFIMGGGVHGLDFREIIFFLLGNPLCFLKKKSGVRYFI